MSTNLTLTCSPMMCPTFILVLYGQEQSAGQNEHAVSDVPHAHMYAHTHTHRMSKIATEASKKGIRDGVRNLALEICCTDEAGEDAEVPYIKYNFK